jgi:hypothetical protein
MASSVRFTSHKAGATRAITVAFSRAMNRSAISARAVGARVVAKDLGLRVGTIREQIKISRATVVDLTVTLSVRGRRIPLIEFSASGKEPSRGKGRGVSYRLGGQRRRIPTAFIATMKSGHRGVFRRILRGRLPIVELLGPSIAVAFSRKPIVEAISNRFREAMSTNLQHEIEFEVRQT